MESQEVKTIRVKFGLSQEQFAKLIGVSWRTVWRWEHGGKISALAKLRLDEIKRNAGRTWIRDAKDGSKEADTSTLC